MSTEDTFLSRGEEQYQDVPQGGAGRGFIGHAKLVQRWDCGWLDEATQILGKEYSKGRVYFSGAKEDAEAVAKELGSEFVSQVVLISMPVASVTNMSEENKAKFTSGIVQAGVRIVSLKSEKYGAGLNYVTLPSLIDAYARARGWYEKPLFDAAALNGLDKVEDAGYAIASLAEMRRTIWAALGEADPTKTFQNTKSDKLKSAFEAVYLKAWDGWVRLIMANDPSPKAYYTDKTSGEGKRQRVPCIVEFFKGEKDAIEVGKKELGDETTKSPNGKVGDKDYASLYPKLSAEAKTIYTSVNSWIGAFPELGDLATKAATKPAQIKLAQEYCVTLDDLALVKNL